ncbi:hypothetical protein F2P56_010666 [Juglans regia]|uniref:Ankyrin repeat and SAM domain-containing protein 1A-like n=2 Tax=Juglans regia TaxID=51240 RepID=A0A2I4HUB1_JUGRE|nr:ankyrin repeat and SAM domain-containing protein 1A-like [Juglans regia]KAF5470132.1 hypothetical protein F2P56_010666 [Juglans regia]
MAATSEESTMLPGHRDEDQLLIRNLYNAVRAGNLEETRHILEYYPEALNMRITYKNETALHIAVIYGHEHIVELLVNQMSNEGLTMYDYDGNTALILAAMLGKCRMAECMLRKYPCLIRIRDSKRNRLPVAWAMEFGQIEMARRLYDLTCDEDLIPQDNDEEIQYSDTATLLNNAIYTGTLDIALRLIRRWPRLALTRGNTRFLAKPDSEFLLSYALTQSPIYALTSMRQSFSSENQLGFWKKRIYSCITTLSFNSLALYCTFCNIIQY